MPTHTRTFRVFASSTFADLKAERDELAQRVFPRIRELCQQYGARFQAVDLRWGVSSEAGLDQRTMQICLEELRRSQQISPRPNFVVLLGDRYGWRPLPYAIPGDEFAEVERRCPTRYLALLREWYPLDENAVVTKADGRVFAENVLRERTGEYKDDASWGDVERELTAALREATAGMELSPESRLKYGASAT
ncbi:MAG: DUF4062 domain-containing protein [Acidobacteriota bacterium]